MLVNSRSYKFIILIGILSTLFPIYSFSNIKKTINSKQVRMPRVEICDTAKAILADTLKYHPSTDHLFVDMDVDYSNPLLLPLMFFGKQTSYCFEISPLNKTITPPKYEKFLSSCLYEKEIEIDSMRLRSMEKAIAQNPYKITYYWNALPIPPKEEVLNYEINKN